MSTTIKTLIDKLGNSILPVTKTKAVYDDEGARLDNTLSDLTTLVSNKASASLVSDAFSSSKTYAQGEFCIYNNTLWKSKVNSNLGQTPTEGSYWTATNVSKGLITTDGEGNYGYLKGDDTFVPFKSGSDLTLIGQGSANNVTTEEIITINSGESLKNYKNLVFSFYTIDINNYINSVSTTLLMIISYDNLKDGVVRSVNYLASVSGTTGTVATANIKYVNDTQISLQKNNTGSRRLRVYGFN